MNDPHITQKRRLIALAHNIYIDEQLDQPFMDFRARVTAKGIDENLNGERRAPDVRGYLDRELHICPERVSPETDIREGVQHLTFRFHARELADEWEVVPIYEFIASHLEPINLKFPEEYNLWGKKQEYMMRRYRDQWIAHYFRAFRLKELAQELQNATWAPAEDFLKLAQSLDRFVWPTEEQFAECFADDRLIEPYGKLPATEG